MKAAPIIFTRTFYTDYEFRVKPETFTKEDTVWALNYIRKATGKVELEKGVRWLIVDHGTYRMAGVAGRLDAICAQCNLADEVRTRSEEMYRDNFGRAVIAFIGVVIDKLPSATYGQLSLDYLWSIYLEKISPIWLRTYQTEGLSTFTDMELHPINYEMVSSPEKIGELEFYSAEADEDFKLFTKYLCSENREFSFCSNVTEKSYGLLREGAFTIVTTSAGNRDRFINELQACCAEVPQNTNIGDSIDFTGKVSDEKTKKKIFTWVKAKFAKIKAWFHAKRMRRKKHRD